MEKTIGIEFMKQTECKNLGESDRAKKLTPPPLELPYDESLELIKLPEPDLLEDKEVNFLQMIEIRSSVRQYRDLPLTLKELSYLLWCTQGVKMVMPTGASLRNVPSAGARHAFETYLCINRVEGVAPGLYRFLALEHVLIPVNLSQDVPELMSVAFMKQSMITKGAVTFIWAAVLQRMAYAYGQRAYRYLHLDAGHVCQNLYLAAQTIDCGTCAIAHFDDQQLNQALEIDGENQFAIYSAAVGK